MKAQYKIDSTLKTNDGTIFTVEAITIARDGVVYADKGGNKYEQNEIQSQFREVKPRTKKIAKTATAKKSKSKNTEAQATA